jgi:hypothetical protein
MKSEKEALDAYAAVTAPARRSGADIAARVRRRAEWTRRRRQVIAAGVAGLVLLGVVGGVAVGTREPPPVPVARTFEASSEAALGDAVTARWDGSGSVTGDSRRLAARWEVGTIAFEVAPGRGVQLSVHTDEADVRVVGTGFELRRDALGTGVAVLHGVVAVGCAGLPERRLGVGETIECLPVTPAALLGRARAQQRRGDPLDAVIATLDAGARDATGPVATELRVFRASVLAAAGRAEEALVVAEAALAADPGGRRLELLRLSTTLATATGGCDRARPFAIELRALGEPTACAPESP